ncbi:hypothetical protein B9Z19DRAFT_47024 [Tuber borchii]|uniref:Uncharacterized protein n=1 Tax=Tuber borchii TaxID=42251 RepID=A0A2T7A6V3_TUBBO|nr:hypothetical protein B9Z19DRAFT_47024 [Tuber borchii]
MPPDPSRSNILGTDLRSVFNIDLWLDLRRRVKLFSGGEGGDEPKLQYGLCTVAGMKKEGGDWEVGLWLCKPATSSRSGIGFSSWLGAFSVLRIEGTRFQRPDQHLDRKQLKIVAVWMAWSVHMRLLVSVASSGLRVSRAKGMVVNLQLYLRALLVTTGFSNLALAKCQEISKLTVWAKCHDKMPRIIVLCKNDVLLLKTKVDRVYWRLEYLTLQTITPPCLFDLSYF